MWFVHCVLTAYLSTAYDWVSQLIGKNSHFQKQRKAPLLVFELKKKKSRLFEEKLIQPFIGFAGYRASVLALEAFFF